MSAEDAAGGPTAADPEFAAAFLAVVEPLAVRLRLHSELVRNGGRITSLAWLREWFMAKCGEVPVVPMAILLQKMRKTKPGEFPTADLLIQHVEDLMHLVIEQLSDQAFMYYAIELLPPTLAAAIRMEYKESTSTAWTKWEAFCDVLYARRAEFVWPADKGNKKAKFEAKSEFKDKCFAPPAGQEGKFGMWIAGLSVAKKQELFKAQKCLLCGHKDHQVSGCAKRQELFDAGKFFYYRKSA
ncbi:hypothetical protein PLESTB_000277300 [Pleodorina starrii]|uniref:Uncharacterized protein n=1 Tax=Pleodorina starrii TaxID=330485 RepID=A0A9W6BCS0_9CHLO|nr:hypothetical protein PLESTB_000277300 [Pleodorina starrii]GLC77379.1 hypothetical protein PLESTF_001927400 [Pleodorina starrii]